MGATILQLFARPPVAGQVKSRLAAEIGAANALAVYRHCLQTSLSLARDSGFEHEIWLTAPSYDPLFQHIPTRIQRGHDLGQRMLHALEHALAPDAGRYSKALLIGSDCLDLSTGVLHRVAQKLDEYSLVLVPARDGGYVLIAARGSIDRALFEGIEWGSSKVLIQTLEQAMKQGIDTYLLNPLRDIDHREDMQQYPVLHQYL